MSTQSTAAIEALDSRYDRYEREGEEAAKKFLETKIEGDNPYKEGVPEHFAWNRGWNFGITSLGGVLNEIEG